MHLVHRLNFVYLELHLSAVAYSLRTRITVAILMGGWGMLSLLQQTTAGTRERKSPGDSLVVFTKS